jgi:3-hydroxyacyl-[acyl-carrier-protein] dehydratase
VTSCSRFWPVLRNDSYMDQKLQINAPVNHPSYDGHFPGNPVVPGVVLLELIVEALARGAPRAISHVKFHRALKPGDAFGLDWEAAGERLKFRCDRAGELIAEGALIFGAPG